MSDPVALADALEEQIANLQARLEDMTVQALFWKQAAEHAVDGWTKQEDVSIALREKLVQACRAGASCDVAQCMRLEAEALADDAPEDT